MSDITSELRATISVKAAVGSRTSAVTINLAAQDLVDEYRQSGFAPTGVYTGTKGGEVFEVARNFSSMIVQHKDLIIALANLLTPVVMFYLKRFEDRQTKDSSTQGDKFIIIYPTVPPVRKEVIVTSSANQNDWLLNQLLEIENQLPNLDVNALPISVEVEVKS